MHPVFLLVTPLYAAWRTVFVQSWQPAVLVCKNVAATILKVSWGSRTYP